MSKKNYSVEDALKALDILENYQSKEIEGFQLIRDMREKLKYFLKSKNYIDALVYVEKISEIYRDLIYEFDEKCIYIISTYLDTADSIIDRDLYQSFIDDYERLKNTYLKYRLIYDKILRHFKMT